MASEREYPAGESALLDLVLDTAERFFRPGPHEADEFWKEYLSGGVETLFKEGYLDYERFNVLANFFEEGAQVMAELQKKIST